MLTVARLSLELSGLKTVTGMWTLSHGPDLAAVTKEEQITKSRTAITLPVGLCLGHDSETVTKFSITNMFYKPPQASFFVVS